MKKNSQFADGLRGLKNPVLPLVRIVQFLYLTGPFTTIAEILDELKEPIETNAVTYNDPKKTLSLYLDILKEFERLKDPEASQPPYTIFDREHNKLNAMESIGLWVSQQMLCRELEHINSQLCGPCGCDLCCIGPKKELRQEFFEIPLSSNETNLFPLSRIDNSQSRETIPYSQTTLQVNNQPFYQNDPKLIRWQSGWSLILPKETTCPQLDRNKSNCQIYPQRPDVCRRPQIFSYLLEQRPQDDNQTNMPQQKAYTHQNKLLAIWDCPYVKKFQTEVAAYAEMCELEPIFKKNKE